MNEELEYIMSLASEGKYDEARKAVDALDISASKKATFNMQIWQMQRKTEAAGYAPERIPKIPVISMILGFVLLISAGIFTNGSLQDLLFVTGIIMAGAIPAYYCIKEKRLADQITQRHDKEANLYSEEGADINFSRPLPSSGIIVTGVAAAVMLMLGMFMTNLSQRTARIPSAVFFSLIGFILFYLCFRKNHNHNAAVSFLLLSISTFLIFVAGLTSVITNGSNTVFCLLLVLAAALILLFYPVSFKLVKLFKCTEVTEAECIDILCVSGGYGGRGSHRPRYHAIWKYSYNGTVYIHKDMASYKSPVFGEKTELLIDPRDPHNTYRRKAPITSAFFILAGLCMLVSFIPLFDKIS